MEEQCSPLGWAYYYQEEGADVLKQSLLYSTLELEAAVVSAHDEISRKDDEILQLKALLSKIIKERDDFQASSHDLALEKQLLFQQLQILQAHSSDHQHLDPCPISSAATSNDHRDDAASAASCKDTLPLITPPPPPLLPDVTEIIALKRPLPEQGKFHQAVMDAGPLLQTLLLAGPLPRWQHPPPQLSSVDIPPVTTTKIISPDSCLISPTTSGGLITNKRAMVSWDGSDFSPSSKYQKACSPTMIVDPQHT